MEKSGPEGTRTQGLGGPPPRYQLEASTGPVSEHWWGSLRTPLNGHLKTETEAARPVQVWPVQVWPGQVWPGQVWAGQAGSIHLPLSHARPWEWRGRPRLAHSATYRPAAWLLAKPAARNSDHSLDHKCLQDKGHSASDPLPPARQRASYFLERKSRPPPQSHPWEGLIPLATPHGESRPEGLRASGPVRALAEVGWGGQPINHMRSGSTLGAVDPPQRGA